MILIASRNSRNFFVGTDDLPLPVIEGWGAAGGIHLQPHIIERSVSNIERLWAYLTIKQLLEFKEVADRHVDVITKKALDLALRYSFVTPVSSLVVVKPNSTDAVDTEKATSNGTFNMFISVVFIYSVCLFQMKMSMAVYMIVSLEEVSITYVCYFVNLFLLRTSRYVSSNSLSTFLF